MTVLKTAMRNFFAHKGRMALSAVAVLLSVAFVCGTLVFTDTMTNTFDKLFKDTASDVTVSAKGAKAGEDIQQSSRPQTLPASLLERLEKAEGVKSVVGEVSSQAITLVGQDNENIGASSGAPTIATNWDQNETEIVEITSGHEPRGPTEVMLDSTTAEKAGLEVGATVRVIAVPGEFTATVSGIVTFVTANPGATLVYTDTPTAQTKLLGEPDVFTNLMLTAEAGVSHEQLKRTVGTELGNGYKVQTAAEWAEDNTNSFSSFLDVMKYAMLGFAGIALLVGIFLIVNTFSMLVAQRTREIGLMRAVGASRAQVNRGVLVEAVLLGVLGSVLGVGAGIGLAVGLMELMGRMGMELSTDELTVAWTTPVTGLVLGVVVTVLAAYLPARRAGKISPMAALRDAGTPGDRRSGWVRAGLGLLLTGSGGAALIVAAGATEASGGALYLGAGVVLTLIGFVVIGPLLAGLVVRVISLVVLRLFGPVGRLAERNALRNPRRTGATAAALMIGLALVAGLSVVGSSMVASAGDQLDRSLGADFIIESGTGQPFTPEVEKAVKAAAGLEHVTDYKILDAKVTTPDGKSEDTQLTAADPTYVQDLRTETVQGDLSAAYDKDGVSVSEGFAEDHGIKVGSELAVDFKEGGAAKLTVNVITTDDTVFDKGAMYLSIATAESYFQAGKMPMNAVMFATAEDGREAAAYTSLKKGLDAYPQVQVRDQADYKKLLEDQIGQILNMVYGLLALAIVVAVLGVVNTLALSVVERTREIGLMRAIGMSRRQLRRMIRLESVVIAVFGAVIGLGLGMGWGVTAQQLLELEGFGVLEIPWTTILTVFVGSAVVGLIAALVPAFRAGRMNVLNAIATD